MDAFHKFNFQLSSESKMKIFDSFSHNKTFKNEILIPLLEKTYQDLCGGIFYGETGITKSLFIEYSRIEGLLGSRLFDIMDKDHDLLLSKSEFIKGMCHIYSSSLRKKIQLIFDLYDFDQKGLISRNGVTIILSHCPINPLNFKVPEMNSLNNSEASKKSSMTKLKFIDRIINQEEISRFLNICFNKANQIDLISFNKIIYGVSSEIFLIVYSFIRKSIPIQTQLMYLSQNKPSMLNESSTMMISTLKIIVSSKIVKEIMINSPTKSDSKSDKKLCDEIFTFQLPKIPTYNNTSNLQMILDKSNEEGRKTNYIKGENIQGNSNLENIKENKREIAKKVAFNVYQMNKQDFNLGSSRINLNLNFDLSLENINAEICGLCGGKVGSIHHICTSCYNSKWRFKGYIYLFEMNWDLRKYWAEMTSNEIYYYDQPNSKYLGIINLFGRYLHDCSPVSFNGKTYFHLQFISSCQKREIFFETEKDKQSCFDIIKETIPTGSISDYYDMREVLGTGKFSTVKLAFDKVSGKPVAIKILSKTDLSPKKLDILRTEISIMMQCQHPNIIKLYDYFENEESISIILEYLGGGDLKTYFLKHHNFLKEERVSNIIHCLSTAIYYLHKMGIIHRDIKLDNCMMADKFDESDVKIVDFGLSRIIAPTEKCNEPFGTVSFVAPEILLRIPYSNSIDIWSLGICAYYLLSGSLPFDGDSDDEIALKICRDDPLFENFRWFNISEDAKNFVSLLLNKNPNTRIKIEDVLKHKFILKFQEEAMNIRLESNESNEFRLFSMKNPYDPNALFEDWN